MCNTVGLGVLLFSCFSWLRVWLSPDDNHLINTTAMWVVVSDIYNDHTFNICTSADILQALVSVVKINTSTPGLPLYCASDHSHASRLTSPLIPRKSNRLKFRPKIELTAIRVFSQSRVNQYSLVRTSLPCQIEWIMSPITVPSFSAEAIDVLHLLQL